MTRHVTVTLDSGAFIQESAPFAKVGYFCCEKGNEVVVYSNGESALVFNLPRGELIFEHLDKEQNPYKQLTRTKAFIDSLLRMRDLYGEEFPQFKEKCFDCTLRFDSGTFSPSVVRPHGFREVHTGETKQTGSIAHDVLIEFELEGNEALILRERLPDEDEVERAKLQIPTPIWTTARLPADWRWANIQIIADSPSTNKFYREAVNNNGKDIWLPNPEPPPIASP
jgi:hypothetical protein